MQVYLPIAELSVNAFVLLLMGGGVGFLSGMFGIGGGFLMTPLLILYGIPPAVAVGTEASQIAASSVSGTLGHWRRKSVDVKMGGVLIAGGALGSMIGILIFQRLRELGQIDVFISLIYVLLLSTIGSLMLWESVRTVLAPAKNGGRRQKHHRGWIALLPFKKRFHKSHLYISVIPPLFLGALVGMLAAIMGVGGGFIMVPALIYLIRMPTNVVVGTSLLQITFVTTITTVLHAVANNTVDIVLALLLIVGGVVGAQYGVRVGASLKGEYLRVLLAVLVLGVCGLLAYDLVMPPTDPYSIMKISS